MSRVLDVYLHDVLAGQLTQGKGGVLSFAYDGSYVEGGKPAVSISMPLQEQSYDGTEVRAFFSGLLPDDIVRHRLAKYLGVSEKNPFSLLEVIGGECAGALSLYPVGDKPSAAKDADIEVLDDKSLKETLDLLRRRPLLAGDDGLRLSLAGAQDKIAVGMRDGKIALLKGHTPTTHILKPLIEDVKDSVHNEVFCMRLAAMMGIDVPSVEIRWLGDTPYFLIERYDRIKTKADKVQRLHQEDFCQAMGIMPDIKYEREGGPSVADCQTILRANSTRPAVDNLRFLGRVIFNYLIGNADAHGKNYSLLYTNAKPQLAPAYDLLCTSVYPELSIRMAMKIGKKYKPDDVFLRHWNRLVPDTKAAHKNLQSQLIKMADNCMEKAGELRSDFEAQGVNSEIFGDITAVIKQRAKHIKGDY